jgi:glutathione S-transferase
MLTLYGQGGSQPSRAVWWTCLIKDLPFELCDVRIDQFGAKGPLAGLNPTGQVPTIQDGDFVLYEMPAILGYLCSKHGWNDLYPRDLETRATIDQYLHFHHNRTRNVTFELMAPHVTVAFLDYLEARGGERNALFDHATNPAKLELGQAAVREIFRLIELGYFRETPYLCTEEPSIADIACYEEVAQLRWANLFDFEEFPKLNQWLAAMADLPHHETAHRYNITLGDIATQANTIERFMGANAAAVEAIAAAGYKTRQLEA